MSKLHLYPQSGSHSDGWLVGDREGLTALRDAISRVLDEPPPAARAQLFSSDGEGYSLVVVLQENPAVWDRLLLPYAKLEDARKDATHPWSELDEGLYKSLLRPSSDR
jgi:hypothetical protein